MSVKICVPITGRNEKEILEQLKHIVNSENFPELSVVELRFDFAKGLEKDAFLPMLRKIKEGIGDKELLFTIRTKEQGGEFSWDYSSYESINCIAIESGYIDMVDIELRRTAGKRGIAVEREKESAWRIVREAKAQNVKSIASYHDFHKTPDNEELREILLELRESGADILKLAVMPKREEDVLRLMLESRRFRERDKNRHEYITLSMGALGALSRVAGELTGSDYSFMTVGESSAPGQLPIGDGLKIMEILRRSK